MAVLVIAHGQPSAGLFSRSRFQVHPTSSSCLRLRRPRLWLNPHFSPPRLSTVNRLGAFRVRCTHTNSDGCNSVATDEVHEDTTSLDSDCSVPVVHLKSDSLETEGLNLLGDTYAGTILTELPVLSDEEQNAIAATPAHPAGLYALEFRVACCHCIDSSESSSCGCHGLFVKVFVHINSQGFQNKKQVGLTIDAPASEQLAVIVGGPLVGKLMDHFPRVPAYNCLTVIQVAAQLLSVGMIIHAHNIHPSYVSSVLVQPWFVVLVIALAVERLSGLALGLQWSLAGTNRTIALAQANAVLSRIDLLCEIAGASLFGIFLSKYEPVTCLKMAASLMMWSLPVVVVLTWLTNKLSAGVLNVPNFHKLVADVPLQNLSQILKIYVNITDFVTFGWVTSFLLYSLISPFLCIVGTSIEAIKHGWFEYIQQPVLPASLAYVLLYFNVLAPGGLMTAFLTQHDGTGPFIILLAGDAKRNLLLLQICVNLIESENKILVGKPEVFGVKRNGLDSMTWEAVADALTIGLNPSIIGGFSGLCAFMGVAATFVSAKMVERLGILKAGAAGLIFQAALLTIAVAVYWIDIMKDWTSLKGMLQTALSDGQPNSCAWAQILQTGIPASKANLIGTTEVSFASLAESVMLGVAIIANDVSHFGFLAMLSLMSVVGAAWLYCGWLKNPTDTQRNLFSFERH
ncbi:hypothetical protein DH2020_024209 [Rehmannia glutinosa]|uniref:Solute carrier family 40 protein n=1 Tax=Rehmannia glutinosa TaxID=99300 RepID=A0ABR0WAP8_REHGL